MMQDMLQVEKEVAAEHLARQDRMNQQHNSSLRTLF
jgi:hypothetical protein